MNEAGHSLARGALVAYGFTRGEVLATARRNGVACYLVWDLASPGDFGAVRAHPRWVPQTDVRPLADQGAR